MTFSLNEIGYHESCPACGRSLSSFWTFTSFFSHNLVCPECGTPLTREGSWVNRAARVGAVVVFLGLIAAVWDLSGLVMGLSLAGMVCALILNRLLLKRVSPLRRADVAASRIL